MCKFSFIVPVYNAKDFLESCVRSIIEIGLDEQSEIILVDDGSTDGSYELCETLSRNNCGIRCIHRTNGGVSKARNNGIEQATGQYIIFVDADDTLDSEKMRDACEFMVSNRDIDMLVYGMSIDYYRNGNCYRRDRSGVQESRKLTQIDIKNNLYYLYMVNALSSACTKIYSSRIIIDNILRFQEDMFLYEDFEFCLRYLVHCKLVYVLGDNIYHYRQTEDEGNAGRRLLRIKHLPEVIDRIEESLKSLNGQNNLDFRTMQILLSLYLTIAREKISVESISQIQMVCDDFLKWIEQHNLYEQICDNKYAQHMMCRHVGYLYFRKQCSYIRHKVAVIVKNTKLYKLLYR